VFQILKTFLIYLAYFIVHRKHDVILVVVVPVTLLEICGLILFSFKFRFAQRRIDLFNALAVIDWYSEYIKVHVKCLKIVNGQILHVVVGLQDVISGDIDTLVISIHLLEEDQSPDQSIQFVNRIGNCLGVSFEVVRQELLAVL